MGAWDASAFGNDDAADWAGDLVDSGDESTVRDMLAQVAAWDAAEYLEGNLGAAALVAAEVVATAAGHPPATDPYNEGALGWAQDRRRLAELSSLAVGAIIRVRAAESELNAVWDAAGPIPFAEWIGVLDDLLRRLT